MKLSTCSATVLPLLLGVCHASESLVLNADALTDTRMTLYSGQALLEQRYQVDLVKGSYGLQLSPVSDLLMFETLQIETTAGAIDQLQLQRQPLNSDNFYRGLVGQKIMLYQNGDMQAPHRQARLNVWRNGLGIATLDSGEQLVIDLDDMNGLRVSTVDEHYGKGNFLPQLSARIEQSGRSKALGVRYFSQGIGYQIHYQLQVDHDKRLISGRAVSILNNQTSTDFNAVKLVLASGDTGTQRAPKLARGMMVAESAMMADASGGPESLGELQFYAVAQPVNLPAYSEQQMTLLNFEKIGFEDHYQLSVAGIRPPGSAEHPRRIYRFKADQNLPAGDLRLFEADTEGRLQWILAGRLDSRGEGQPVELTAAVASDILLQREVVQQQRLDRELLQIDWRVKIFNSKATPIRFHIIHQDRNLLSLKAGQGVEKMAANLLRIEVPAGESELLYSAQYRQ